MKIVVHPDHGADPGGTALVSLHGRFDAHEAGAFRTTVGPLVAAPGAVLRLDLSGVAFIDSTALAELVRIMKQTRTTGGDLVLVSLSVPVRVILELTRLDRALTIEPGPEVTAEP